MDNVRSLGKEGRSLGMRLRETEASEAKGR